MAKTSGSFPPTPPEKLAKVAEMLDDGCSFKEIEETLHIAHKTLKKYFPGRGWTPQQLGAHGLFVKRMNTKINKVSTQYV